MVDPGLEGAVTYIYHDITAVFNGFADVWGAAPAPIRFAIIGCFGLACFIAVVKMLF